MILAEKIAMLRRRQGWSQEDLAERLGVSRQSVSKYESAQSVPDLSRVVRMSEFFGVSTDYLLKDDYGEADAAFAAEEAVDGVMITQETAQAFLAVRKRTVKLRALAMLLFVWSPAFLISCHAFSSRNPYHVFAEDQASMTGLVILLMVVAAGVVLNLYCSFRERDYDFLETGHCHASSAVSEMLSCRRQEFNGTDLALNIISIVLFCVSPVPLLISSLSDNDFQGELAVSLLLLTVGLGVLLRTFSSGTVETLDLLAGTNRTEDEEEDDDAGSRRIYWGIVCCIYFVYSWISGDWSDGMLVFVIAWALRPALNAVFSHFAGR